MSDVPLYRFDLTAEEAVLLDGSSRPEIQSVVDRAKRELRLRNCELSPQEARFVDDVLEHAAAKGKLVFRHVRLRSCRYSGKTAGYATYTRSSRHHRKGDTNWKKPLFMAGVDLADSVIRMKGRAEIGCCLGFWKAVRPKLLPHLEDIKAEIPEEIMGHPPHWRKWLNHRCSHCGWEGHEGQMGQVRTFMGDGTFRGKCPGCGAENGFLRTIVEVVDGFALVPADESRVR